MTKVLITGSTGMVGKGVLLECIQDSRISSITLINRSAIDIQSPKIKEILLQDFLRISSIKDELDPFDACFHCMGVSSVGMDEETYTRLTFELTRRLADLCFELNPGMTFNYVSGSGTDSSESGSPMWTRVKGKTENYLLNKGFGKAYMFRAGVIIPENGIQTRTRLYDYAYTLLRPFFPLLKKLRSVTTTTRLGRAMINCHFHPEYDLKHLENRDINRIAG